MNENIQIKIQNQQKKEAILMCICQIIFTDFWQWEIVTMNEEGIIVVKIITRFIGYLLIWCMAVPTVREEAVMLINITTSTTLDIQEKDGYLWRRIWQREEKIWLVFVRVVLNES